MYLLVILRDGWRSKGKTKSISTTNICKHITKLNLDQNQNTTLKGPGRKFPSMKVITRKTINKKNCLCINLQVRCYWSVIPITKMYISFLTSKPPHPIRSTRRYNKDWKSWKLKERVWIKCEVWWNRTKNFRFKISNPNRNLSSMLSKRCCSAPPVPTGSH